MKPIGVLELRVTRLRSHLLRNGWGHKNSKASRRALTLILGLGYAKYSDKYLRGAHRLVRESLAEWKRMWPCRHPGGQGNG